MPRRKRFIPCREEGTAVEVCSRSIHGIHLLTPTTEFVDVAGGTLGRALEVQPVELCGISMLSNHCHGIVVVQDHKQLSRFMGHFNGNLAKEVHRLHDWPDCVFPRRFTAMTISDEPEAQLARLKYILSQSVKEGLVESPYDWKGLHAAKPLAQGGYLEGHWYNRTEEWRARRRREAFDKYEYATKYQIRFAQLPAFRHLSEDEYRELIAELVQEIVDEEREKRQGSVKGMKNVQVQDPRHRPKRTKRSPAPRFLAASMKGYLGLVAEYREFLVHYRAASEKLKVGDFGASMGFPVGCFPPSMPFVGPISESILPPPPPTREVIRNADGVVVFLGEIPVVEVPIGALPIRGQPPPIPNPVT